MLSLIIGVGNRFRRDDGAGPEAARRLAEVGFESIEHSGDGAALIDLFDGRGSVIIVDTAQSGAPPGTVHVFDAAGMPLPSGFFRYSSHAFGVAEAVETARSLGRLPPDLCIYGVEGGNFDFGEGMSDPVKKAVGEVVEAIAKSCAE